MSAGTASGMRGELSKQTASLEDAVFGVLYTLSKEKGHENKVFVVVFFLVEFVQLMLFSLSGNNTNMWGWHMNYNNVFWKWLNYFQLENPMTNAPSGSYSFWLAFFYILVFLMAASLGLCVYVAICFKSGSFPYVWPVKLLRAIVSVIFSVLFVSALDVFLVGVACVPATPHSARCVLYNFPTVRFQGLPALVHGVIGIVMSIFSIIISYLLTIGDSEQNVMHRELLGTADSMVKSRRMVCSTLLTLLSNFLIAYNKLLSLMLLAGFGFMLADQVANLPYHHDFSNYLAVSTGALLAWCPLLLVVKMYTSGPRPFYASPPAPVAAGAGLAPGALGQPLADNSKLLTQIGFYGSPFVALLFLGLTWGRLRRFRRLGAALVERIRLLEKDEGALPEVNAFAQALYDDGMRFGSVVEVEIVSRVARVTLHQKEGERDPAVLLAAETVLLVGVTQFQESSLMNILYACFLMDICADHPRGYSYLDKARALAPTLRERFMIFARDRERTQRAQGDSMGGGSMDLVSYVEFQSSFANLMQVHRSARRSNRNFWRLLVNANVSFRALSQAFESMDSTEAQADRLYRTTLIRYPRSAKLMRAYGGFLEEVRNNPWAARKMFEEADKAEESQSELIGDQENVLQVNEKVDAVCVINPGGVITNVNKILLKMFGYKHTEELEGKNVSMLMPAPFAQLHNTYLKRFMATGKATILNTRRKLEARHKAGHNFAVSLLVTKMETGGEVSFMAVITATPPEEAVRLAVSAEGVVVEANGSFEAVFRRPADGVVGKPLASLLSGASAESLESACQAAAEGATVVRMLDAHARGGDSFPANVELSPGSQTANGAPLVLGQAPSAVQVRVFPLLGAAGQIVIDDLGQIQYSDAFAGRLFGRPISDLVGKNVSELMPRPYSAFHGSYMADHRIGTASRVVGAPHGRCLPAQHRDGRVFAIMLTVAEMSLESGRRLFSGRMALRAAGAEEPLCLQLTITDSGEVLSASGPPGYLQMDPQEILGRDLEEILSWRDGVGDSRGLMECLKAMPPHMDPAEPHDAAAAEPAACAPLAAVLASPPPALPLSLRADGLAAVPVCVSVRRAGLRSLEINLWSQSAVDGVCAINSAGRIVSATHGLCLLLGYSVTELLGRDLGEAFMPAHIAAQHQSWVEQVPMGQDGRPRQAAPFRRVVDAIHRSGAPVRILLEVATAAAPRPEDTEPAASAVFVARFTASSEPLGAGVPDAPNGDPACQMRRAAWKAFRLSPASDAAKVAPEPPYATPTATSRYQHGVPASAAVAPGASPNPARTGVKSLPPPPATIAGAVQAPELAPAAAAAAAQAWDLVSRNEAAVGAAVLQRFFELQPSAASLPPFASPTGSPAPAVLNAAALTAMLCAGSLVTAMQPPPRQAPGSGLSRLRRAAAAIVAELSPLPAFASVENSFVESFKDAFLEVVASAYGDRDTLELADARAAAAAAAAAAVVAALPPRGPGGRLRSGRVAWARNNQFVAQEGPTEWASEELQETEDEPREREQHRGLLSSIDGLPSPFGGSSPPLGRALYDSLWTDAPGAGASRPRPRPVAEALGGAALLDATAAPAGGRESSGAGERGYPADVVARARRGHCIFFMDPEQEERPAATATAAPHPLPPGATAASCPFLATRAAAALPGPVSESAAVPSPAGGGGCVFAQAMQGPAAKLPPGLEAAMAARRLLEAQRAVSTGGGSAAGLAAATAAAAQLAPHSERGWEELLGARDIRWAQPPRGAKPASRTEADAEPEWEADVTARAVEGAGERGGSAAGRSRSAGPVTEAFTSPIKLLHKPAEVTAAEGELASKGNSVAEALDESLALSGRVRWRSTDGGTRRSTQTVKQPEGSREGSMRGKRGSGEGMRQRQSSITLTSKDSTPNKPPAVDWKRISGNAKSAEPAAEDEDEDDLNDAAALAVKRDAEFQRARRFRQVLKLLNSLQMRRSVTLLRSRTRYVLLLILSSYIGGFITLQVLYSKMTVAFTRIFNAGTLTQLAIEATTRAAQVEALVSAPFVNYTLACFSATDPIAACINKAPNASNTEDVYAAQYALADVAEAMLPVLHGMYLGFNGVLEFPESRVLSHLTTPTVNTTVWVPLAGAGPGEPGGVLEQRVGTPFDSVVEFVGCARAWGAPTYGAGQDFGVGVDPRFLIPDRRADADFLTLNGPSAIFPTLRILQDLELQEQVAASSAAARAALIIVIAVIMVFVAASAYFSRLLEMVARARINLFMVFLVVPQNVVMRLASRSLRAQEDEDMDEDEGEDDWAQRHVPQAAKRATTDGADGANAPARMSLRSRVTTMMRGLSYGSGRTSTVSRASASSAPGTPKGQAGGIGRAWSLVRNRVGAQENRVSIEAKGREMDSAGASSDTYSFMLPLVIWGIIAITTFVVTYIEFTASISPMISMNAASLTDAYATRVRMYAHTLVVAAARGASAPTLAAMQDDLGVAAADLLMQYETVLARGGGGGVQALIFEPQCLRTEDPSGCSKDGEFWEPTTQYGLDTLVRAYVQQAEVLATTHPVTDVAVSSPAFAFIWSIGAADVHDGLRTLVALHHDLAKAPPAVSSILQITFVPVLFFGNVLFVQRFFRPWVKRTMLESRRVAELLAQLPNEVSVEALVLEAMGRGGATAPDLKAAMRGQSTQVVDSARGSHEDELRYALGHHKVENE